MKKFLVILSLTLLMASNQKLCSYSPALKYTDAYDLTREILKKRNLGRLMMAMAMVESKFNEKIISEKEPDCWGVLQITPRFVEHINYLTGKKGKKYKHSDALSFEKSFEMFEIFQNKYNPEMDYEKGTRIWCGGQNLKRATKATLKYYGMVLDQLRKLPKYVQYENMLPSYANSPSTGSMASSVGVSYIIDSSRNFNSLGYTLCFNPQGGSKVRG